MSGPPDLIVMGHIASLAGAAGFGWADGVAVHEGRVVAVGSRSDVLAMAGPATRRLELASQHVALPAVTDAHIHLVDAALGADDLDLEGVPTLEAALALVADAHARRSAVGDRDSWLLGHGWTMDAWAVRPSAAALETVAPGRPVALWAHDHHTRWLSEAALAAMGIDRAVAAAGEGAIGRLADGRPDGLLHEHATGIGAEAIPRPTAAAVAAAIERYAARLAAMGVIGAQDPGGTAPDPTLSGGLHVVRSMAIEGRLPLRVHAGIRDEQLRAAIAAGLRSGQGVPTPDGTLAERLAAERFRVGWLKLFSDGSVGSRTAAMLEPYDDDATRPGPAGSLGMLLETRERMTRQVMTAAKAGIGTMIHAIGDRAVRTVLDAFEAAGRDHLAATPSAPRVEHAQLIQPGDRARFERLGVVASLQPVQLRSDEATMQRAWGGRRRLAFPLASLLAAGAEIAFGTDAPVESPDPWPGIAMAVARWAPEWGSGALPSAPGEGIPLWRALRAATAGPRASAGEASGGRLVPGAPADLVVLDLTREASPDLDAWLDGSVETIRVARPLLTLLDGQERWRDPDFER